MTALSTDNTITSWADEIRPHLTAAVENIIAVGAKLNTAKNELAHGQFGPLLAELGLSRQMANRFMRVASNPVIANRSPVGGLPAAVSVLDVLAQLDDDDLQAAIAAGDVSPSTTRLQAAKVVAAYSDPIRRRHAPEPIRARVDKVVNSCICDASISAADRNMLVLAATLTEGTQYVYRTGEMLEQPDWWPNSDPPLMMQIATEIKQFCDWLDAVGIDERFVDTFLHDGPIEAARMLDDDALLAWDCPDDFTLDDRRLAAVGRWFCWSCDPDSLDRMADAVETVAG